MAKLCYGDNTDKGDCARDGLRAIDETLTWVRPAHRNVTRNQWRGLPTLERELVDLHARYERACVED